MDHTVADSNITVLFVASEVAPFAKTGGLGDVIGSLPPALNRLGAMVHVMMPYYGDIDGAAHGVEPMGLTLEVDVAGQSYLAQVHRASLQGCPVYLIAQDEFFGRPGIYGDANGDFGDNDLRYGFLCRAAVLLAGALDLRAQVVHCHDWQTGLLPAYLRTRALEPGPLSEAATVMTIHNLAHQGVFPRGAFGQTGLPPHLDAPEGIEYWGNISFLKAGLLYADALTTVSPGYAREILGAEGGMGMEGVLSMRADRLAGILNGADYAQWSPEVDALLPAGFAPDDLSGKAVCRKELLRAFGLEAGPEAAVMGFVGRLAHQKGVDLIADCAQRLLLDDVRLCLLGSGDPGFEGLLSDLAARYPRQVGVKLRFSEELAHLTLAGSDLLLMPSRFEPCGLSQLYALRYGSIPVVRLIGGLKDTVAPFDPITGRGTGFGFSEATGEALLCALREALWTKARPQLWDQLVYNAMTQDFSWHKSARAYLNLYQRLLAGLPPLG